VLVVVLLIGGVTFTLWRGRRPTAPAGGPALAAGLHHEDRLRYRLEGPQGTMESSVALPAVFGRASTADVVISDPGVSRHHARATLAGAGAIRIEDLGSSNGVVVAGAKVPSAAVAEECGFKLGGTTVTVIACGPQTSTGGGHAMPGM
jgi:hypothetical protein